MSASSKYLYITTIDDRLKAERICQHLIEKKLAACVQIHGPVSSYFSWQDKVEQAREFCIWIKSEERLFKKIEKFIESEHPYEVPQLIGIPINQLASEYCKWFEENLEEVSAS